jgi:molybdate transport system ATP-binding protein
MKFEIAAKRARSNGFVLDAAFACDAGALAIVGPSGSGKSTLLDAIAGIEPGARVSIDGVDYSSTPLHERRVGYVTQDALLFPHLSVRENLTYSPRAGSIEDAAEALEITALLDRKPGTLSGGERRRVALARAIVSRPALLLLDEPFSGLDELRRREAMSLLGLVRNRFGLSMILVSHRADEVIGLTDWAVRLESGRVAASGPSLSILRSGEVNIDNYIVGRVVGPGKIDVGGVELFARVGSEGSVRLACYAHDILLATEEPRGISARNCFWSTVASIAPAGDAMLVTLGAPPLRVLVTPEAVRSLQLGSGKRVVAIIKATSLAYMGAA